MLSIKVCPPVIGVKQKLLVSVKALISYISFGIIPENYAFHTEKSFDFVKGAG